MELGKLSIAKKNSKIKEASIEKISRAKSKQSRNISLPNLKKKPSNRENRRLKMQKRKTKMKGLLYSKSKGDKWGDLFFHYFEEIVDRFVTKKLEIKHKKGNIGRSPARSRLFSEDIHLDD